MNLFRLTTFKYSDFNKLINGRGTINGGRWNPKGLPASYFGLKPIVCYAEKGHYAIKPEVEVFNKNYAGKSSIPIDAITNLIRKEFILSSLVCKLGVTSIMDISTENRFKHFCAREKIEIEFKDAIKREWYENPKTQKIGTIMVEKGFTAMIVKSARYTDKCLVLFPANLSDSSSFSLKNQTEVKLSCVPAEYDPPYDLKKDGLMEEGAVYVEVEEDEWKGKVVDIHPW